jgi:hypothetical protein
MCLTDGIVAVIYNLFIFIAIYVAVDNVVYFYRDFLNIFKTCPKEKEGFVNVHLVARMNF